MRIARFALLQARAVLVKQIMFLILELVRLVQMASITPHLQAEVA